MFCVVNFVGGMQKTVVPDTWLSTNDALCLLPPNAADVEVLSRNCVEPREGWHMLEVSSVETFESYSEAKKQLEKSPETLQSESNSYQKRWKRLNPLEDHSTRDSDDSQKQYTVFRMHLDDEATSENEFFPRIKSVSSVKKIIPNHRKKRSRQSNESPLSTQKENINVMCDCQSSCHATFLRALRSVQRQVDKTNEMVCQLLGDQTHRPKTIPQPIVNRTNETDGCSQDSSSSPERMTDSSNDILVSHGTRRTLFKLPSSLTEFKKAACTKFSLDPSRPIIIQSYNESWKEYIDLDDDSELIPSGKYRILPQPPTSSCSKSLANLNDQSPGVHWEGLPEKDSTEINKSPLTSLCFPSSLEDALRKKIPLTQALRSELIKAVCDYMTASSARPSIFMIMETAGQIMKDFPHLKESFGTGYCGWKRAIRDHLENARKFDEGEEGMNRKRKIDHTSLSDPLPPSESETRPLDSDNSIKFKDDQLELAPGVHIKKDQWEEIVSDKKLNPSRFTRRLAVALWGAETLRERSVTGNACRRFQKAGVKAKKALEPAKVDAVQNGLRYWLTALRGMEEEPALEISSKFAVRKMLSDKIMDLIKQKKIT